MEIEKFISYQIESQFPQIYREEGQELVAFVKAYYEFLEEQPGQTLYEGRRIYEYRDIDRTLENMILFFKNKFLTGMPYNRMNIRFIIKNILDLYRRRGTEEGIQLFFRMFYNEDASVKYPAKNIFKPSHSEWRVTKYLQMDPSTDITNYQKILGKRIYGLTSKAVAVADRINFVIINGSFTPIIFINEIIGEFVKYDEIISEVLGVYESFGRVNGSISNIALDTLNERSTSGNKVGQIVNIESQNGSGAKAIVTKVNENATGEITYNLIDGGFGYTTENTKLLVSNQIIFLTSPTEFFKLETLEDQLGNRGIVTGYANIFVAVRMESGKEFIDTSVIQTIDRPSGENITVDFSFLSEKNETSPGSLYPEVVEDGGTQEEQDFAVRALIDETEAISVITDVIGDFANVALDSTNFNDVPPALKEMSGNTDPVTLSTTLEDAFNLESFDIGRITGFVNIVPGANYVNDVFAIALDPVMAAFNKTDQNITLSSSNLLFSVGDEVSQGSVKGIIRAVSGSTLTITPFSYYGFNKDVPLTYRGIDYDITVISANYENPEYGNNAEIEAVTEFAVGKIEEVNIVDTGFGYVDGYSGSLTNNEGDVLAVGSIETSGQGFGEGFWSTFDSHVNGYRVDESNTAIYYEFNKRLRDNDFYQEYSYEISTKVDINTYEGTLRDVVHVSGSKVFGKFVFYDAIETNPDMIVSLNLG